MTRDWSRLGEAVTAAYLSLGYGLTDFAQAVGVSRSTISRLVNGAKGPAPSPKTLAGIERALGWPTGTCIAIAEGASAPAPSEPHIVSISRAEALDDPELLDRLPEQIRQELASGDLIGVDVVDLGATDSGTRMLVILKRDRDAPELLPEEKRALMSQWQAMRRLLWTQQPAESSAGP